jgi:hypothetical protein
MSNSKVALTTQDEPMPETLSPTYISGPMLIPVVLAILLSMFLVALDMVFPLSESFFRRLC